MCQPFLPNLPGYLLLRPSHVKFIIKCKNYAFKAYKDDRLILWLYLFSSILQILITLFFWKNLFLGKSNCSTERCRNKIEGSTTFLSNSKQELYSNESTSFRQGILQNFEENEGRAKSKTRWAITYQYSTKYSFRLQSSKIRGKRTCLFSPQMLFYKKRKKENLNSFANFLFCVLDLIGSISFWMRNLSVITCFIHFNMANIKFLDSEITN